MNPEYVCACVWMGTLASLQHLSVLTFTSDPQVWSQKGFYPSEPVFVPLPGGQDEDDGVILSVVLTPSQVRLETGRFYRAGFSREKPVFTK